MTQNITATKERVALITGGSQGLGRALVTALASAGWRVITDARNGEWLRDAAELWGSDVETVVGDLTERGHRRELVAAVERRGRLDLLVHNASTLGPTPLPPLASTGSADLEAVWRTNVAAPLALTTSLVRRLRESEGILLSVSSDAAIEHYPGWGLYAASKAALDQLTLTYAAEEPAIRGYAVDPGDMRTQMHQDAFTGEDISDRPLPESVVPHLLALIESRPASARLRAADVPTDRSDAPAEVA